MNSTKYYIDNRAEGMYAVMYEDIPIALFDNLIEAQVYQQALESGRLNSYKVAVKEAQSD